MNAVEGGVSRKAVFKAFLTSEEFRALSDEAHKQRFIAEYERDYGRSPYDIGGSVWFHSLTFPDGRTADGARPPDILAAEADVVFKYPVVAKSVLDIGAWDGFFSFQAEKRGAGRVLSTDHYSWGGPGWGSKAGYDYAHAAFGSAAEALEIDVFDLDPAYLGTFDVVLFLGGLYHLQDPLGGLAQAAAMAADLLVVETVTACNDLDYPAMRFFPGAALNGDATNFFAPNPACLQAMLGDLGFSRTEITAHPILGGRDSKGMGRHFVHAWR